MNNSIKLKEESIHKLLIHYSIPAIVGIVCFALYNVVNRIFIGRGPGILAIAGISITFPFFIIIMACGMLVGIGSGSLISIRLGQDKKEEAEKILGNAFTLFLIISIALTTLGFIFMDHFLILFGASAKTLPYAKDYMHIILAGSLFSFISMGMNNLIRAEGNPNIAMKTMLIGAILNIILDPIFIFGFNWGVKGAAIGTVISNCVSAVWVLYHFTAGKSFLKLQFKNMKLDFKIILPALGIGLSPFLMQLTASFTTVISNNTLGYYGGDVAITAMAIINSLTMFFLMPVIGIAQGSQPIIGYNYGAKIYTRVKKTLSLSIISGTIVSLTGFLLVMLFPEFLIKMFSTKNPELIHVGVQGLQIFLLMLPLIGLQIIGGSYFQAVGKPKKSIFLNLLRQVVLFIPFLIILPQFWGLTGIWLVGPFTDCISFLITAGFLVFEIKNLDGKKI